MVERITHMDDNTLFLASERAYTLLSQEEAATGPVSRETIKEHQARRQEIETALMECSNAVQRLMTRQRHLSELPDTEIMDWARAVLAMPNLRFLVIDTTGVDNKAEIIRLLVMDRYGNVTFDHYVYPERHEMSMAANTAHTGIDADTLNQYAESLSALWHNFSEAVTGHYVLAYNLEFIVGRLEENAKYHNLEPLFLIGDDLQEKARRFFEPIRYYPLKLSVCCERIGYHLPTPASASERALGQLAVLRAMAEGSTGTKAVHRNVASDEHEEEVF